MLRMNQKNGKHDFLGFKPKKVENEVDLSIFFPESFGIVNAS